MDAEVLNDQAFDEIPLLKSLHKQAWRQMGSSGGGNHFVEMGTLNVTADQGVNGLARGSILLCYLTVVQGHWELPLPDTIRSWQKDVSTSWEHATFGLVGARHRSWPGILESDAGSGCLC